MQKCHRHTKEGSIPTIPLKDIKVSLILDESAPCFEDADISKNKSIGNEENA